MSAFAGAVVLLLMAAVPAGGALFLVRRKLGLEGGAFWSPFGVLLFVLSMIAVVAIGWVTSANQVALTACSVEGADVAGCDGPREAIMAVSAVSMLAVLIYTIGGLGAHAWLRRRARVVETAG